MVNNLLFHHVAAPHLRCPSPVENQHAAGQPTDGEQKEEDQRSQLEQPSAHRFEMVDQAETGEQLPDVAAEQVADRLEGLWQAEQQKARPRRRRPG